MQYKKFRVETCLHTYPARRVYEKKACQITTRRSLKADSHCVGTGNTGCRFLGLQRIHGTSDEDGRSSRYEDRRIKKDMESRGGFGTHPRVGFFTHRQQVQGGRKPALGLQENYPCPILGQGLSLDMDTGGGEFLLSLGHSYSRTSATEAYPPNAELCRRLLAPLGIDFQGGAGNQTLPFADSCFDMVINRHGNYDAGEVNRILKPGGIFITQQVGEDNDRELVELLLPGTPKPSRE